MMRLSIRHTTSYTYDQSGTCTVQRLRLTPVSNRWQNVLHWTVDAPGFEKAATYVDGFGNRTHLIAYSHGAETVEITAHGIVETRDNGGVAGHLGEAASPATFLRSTPLTDPSDEISGLADGVLAATPLSKLHALLEAIAEQVTYVIDATNSGTSAAEAFAAGQGVCQDHAHIFIAAARRIGIPARYVTGYLHLENEEPAEANHAWAEAWVPDLGWVGFDPANNVCPTDRYVRLACGLDAGYAAPIVGTRRGGGNETLAVDVVVEQQQQQ
ncbi:Transglutaminase-like enzyme, putative cysteine protease [Faunimonas pinastri]|uniref:Transglutaminase-like enzyme, putative cysteine protease n=1 Tax=Faunimonas pinastri TaxID=1855383 RepID=A0A1H9JFA7_9HYPH|nr:transglutaminase family protein [Faunimonas pinastri]SEQ85245.1 Transglutaminase-like enzyme, putative cysteine protease [Faunimonas pinastri]